MQPHRRGCLRMSEQQFQLLRVYYGREVQSLSATRLELLESSGNITDQIWRMERLADIEADILLTVAVRGQREPAAEKATDSVLQTLNHRGGLHRQSKPCLRQKVAGERSSTYAYEFPILNSKNAIDHSLSLGETFERMQFHDY